MFKYPPDFNTTITHTCNSCGFTYDESLTVKDVHDIFVSYIYAKDKFNHKLCMVDAGRRFVVYNLRCPNCFYPDTILLKINPWNRADDNWTNDEADRFVMQEDIVSHENEDCGLKEYIL